MKFTTASLLSLALPALVSAGGGKGGGKGDGKWNGGKWNGGKWNGGHGGHGGGHGGPDKRPLVESEKLQSLMKAKDLLAGSQKLQHLADAHGGNRAFGSGGHNATVDYIYKTLKALNYYDVVKQPFTELFSQGSAELTAGEQSIEAQTMTYTPAGQATAPIVALANLGCAPADYPAEVAGNIALVSRGNCTFSEKSVSAKAAGALAIIIYNNVEGSLAGTLGTPFLDYAPVVGISQEDGQAILDQLSQDAVTATLNVDAIVEERVNFNVIAETRQGDHDNVLMVGGHSDSVAAGPGIK